MQIHLSRVDDRFHFLATNEEGNEVHIDSNAPEGGRRQGAGPMQLLVMGLGGCSGMDIAEILKKGRQSVTRFDVRLDYERAQDQTPALFTKLHAHYDLEGDLDPEKVRRAVELSLGKYCSVAKILEKTVPITYSFSVNGVRHE